MKVFNCLVELPEIIYPSTNNHNYDQYQTMYTEARKCHTGSNYQEKLDATYRSPLSVAVGTSYRFGRSAVEPAIAALRSKKAAANPGK